MVTRTARLRCVIVDDNRHFLEAATNFLERQGVTILGEASNISDALRSVELLRPDVVLVDIDLGEESGLDLAKRIHQDVPAAPPVILISAHAEGDFADIIAGGPAVGFVSKSALSLAAIQDVLDRGVSP